MSGKRSRYPISFFRREAVGSRPSPGFPSMGSARPLGLATFDLDAPAGIIYLHWRASSPFTVMPADNEYMPCD